MAFALGMIFYAPRLVRKWKPRLEKNVGDGGSFDHRLALCLGPFLRRGQIGMAAIIGAFFCRSGIADYSPRWNLAPARLCHQYISGAIFLFQHWGRPEPGRLDRKLSLRPSTSPCWP